MLDTLDSVEKEIYGNLYIEKGNIGKEEEYFDITENDNDILTL